MRKFLLALFVVVFAVMSFGSVAAQEAGTIPEVAAGAGTFNTLLAAVEAAGLAETLSGEGPFTVFAPTDDAFAALPAGVVDWLVAHPDVLAQVLTYHVVAGEVMAADVVGMGSGPVTTVQGGDIDVTVSDAGVMVDGANVTATDIDASNGVIHVIDAVILPDLTLPEVDPSTVSGDVVTAGSSTVFPLSEAVVEQFIADGFSGSITVDSVGTGAGFERFCVAGETDISNASRPIRQEEIDNCAAIEREPIGFLVGVDALAIVVSTETDFVESLTVEQIGQIFSGAVTNWNEVDASYPDLAITLYSPGSDSGTFDYFVEEIFEGDEALILNAAGINLSEDDNVLVQGVSGTPGAIGYFGYAYYTENEDILRTIAVEGVAASNETVLANEYPLSRPLFIYTTGAIMQEKPQVASFVNYYLSSVNDVIGDVGYFPASDFSLNFDKLEWLIATGA